MKRLRWAVSLWLIALCATGCTTRQHPAARDARATGQTQISEPTPAAGQTHSDPPPTVEEAASALATQFYDQWLGAFLQYSFVTTPAQRMQETYRKHAAKALGDDWVRICPDMEEVITRCVDELRTLFQGDHFADPSVRPRLIEALAQAFTPGELERLLAETRNTRPNAYFLNPITNALFSNSVMGPRFTEILKLDSIDKDPPPIQTLRLTKRRMEAAKQRCLHTRP